MTFWSKTEDDTLKMSQGVYRNADMTLTLSTFQITTSEAIPVHKLIKEPSMEGPLGYRVLYIILYSPVLPPKVSCPQLNVAT